MNEQSISWNINKLETINLSSIPKNQNRGKKCWKFGEILLDIYYI